MVPEGWRIYVLEELALVERGKFSARPRNDPKYFGGQIPFVQTGDVGSGCTFLTRFSQTLNNEGLSVSKVFPGSTILMTIAANIGDTVITTFKVACPDSVVAIQAYPEKADTFWLKTVLETKKDDLESKAPQNAQKNINLQVLKPLPILTPPLNEQYAIANTFRAWDTAITMTERLLANSEQQKKALMQQLLTGKKRLPGFNGAWKSHRLGEFFKERTENGFIDLPLLSITSDAGVIPRGEVGRKDTSNEDKSKYLRICPGDIGYNTMRMWQGVSALSTLEGIVSPAYTILKLTDDVHPPFAAYLFKLPRLVHEFYRHSQGLVSDTWNLKYRHFAEIEWAFPGKPEQEAIARVLAAADSEITGIKTQLSQFKDEKKALMQQLLTGKRRVKVNHSDREVVNG